MQKKYVIAALALVIIAVFYLSKIHLPITGTVVDAESGQPIEGAVVLAEWTKTKGIGLIYHKIYKVVEIETNKFGKFTIPGVYNPRVNTPIIIIYKNGYVAARNDYMFPEWRKQNNITNSPGNVVKLERFKEGYSHAEHLDFIEHGIMGLYELTVTELTKIRKAIECEKQYERKRQAK